MKSQRIKITLTTAFRQAVEDYMAATETKSISEALGKLAAIGLQQQTGKPSPPATRQWGGKR